MSNINVLLASAIVVVHERLVTSLLCVCVCVCPTAPNASDTLTIDAGVPIDYSWVSRWDVAACCLSVRPSVVAGGTCEGSLSTLRRHFTVVKLTPAFSCSLYTQAAAAAAATAATDVLLLPLLWHMGSYLLLYLSSACTTFIQFS